MRLGFEARTAASQPRGYVVDTMLFSTLLGNEAVHAYNGNVESPPRGAKKKRKNGRRRRSKKAHLMPSDLDDKMKDSNVRPSKDDPDIPVPAKGNCPPDMTDSQCISSRTSNDVVGMSLSPPNLAMQWASQNSSESSELSNSKIRQYEAISYQACIKIPIRGRKPPLPYRSSSDASCASSCAARRSKEVKKDVDAAIINSNICITEEKPSQRQERRR